MLSGISAQHHERVVHQVAADLVGAVGGARHGQQLAFSIAFPASTKSSAVTRSGAAGRLPSS